MLIRYSPGARNPNSILRCAATLVLALATLVLASCGGGGSSTPPPPPPPPSASLSYQSPQVYVVGQPITPLKPSINVTGGLSGFTLSSVLPLPIGLVLDSTTGIISGTPTYSYPKETYTILATGAGGTVVSASVTISVNAVAANVVSYGSPRFTFTAGVPARTLTPVTAVGVTAWSISPQLPTGLTFHNGSISGTPTAASPPAVYTVTAQTASGPLSVNLTIDVQTTVLVDLGHGSGIVLTQFNGSSILSEDGNAHWVLWNYATGALIANGDSDCLSSGTCSIPGPLAALAGPTAVIRIRSGFQVLSAASGALQASISASASWWSVAPDGTYIVAGSDTSLSAWSPSGQLLFSRAGNYSSAIGFASPGAIRVGAGPAGPSVIESVSVPSGTPTISPSFNGQFASWFVDGSGFLATAGTTVLVYSDAAVQEAVIATPSGTVHGQGPWLWIASGATLNVYALASPTTPVATYPGGLIAASGSTIGLNAGYGVSVIDLSGATPKKVDYTTPASTMYSAVTYAAASASHWVVGYPSGVLLDGASLTGTPRFFGHGYALTVAGSKNHIAVAVASSEILYYNAVTLAPEGTIQFPAVQVVLSSDGSTLAAVSAPSGASGTQLVNVYALPAGSLLFSWPYPANASSPASVEGISLSGSGTVLGQTLADGTQTQQLSPPTGGTPNFSIPLTGPNPGDGSPPQLLLSPNGTLLANSPQGDPNYTPTFDNANFAANIYQNGTLLTAVSGWPVGWLDDTHLLMNKYQPDYSVDTTTDYIGCTICDPTGQISGTCTLPAVLNFQVISSDTLYAVNLNEIASVSTGAVSWMSGDPVNPHTVNNSTYLNSLAGKYVVVASGARVIAQAY